MDELLAIYSDVYKSAHGFRPRHLIPETEEELRAEIDLLVEHANAEEKWLETREDTAYDAWIAGVHKLATGNTKVTDVVRWQFDAENLNPKNKSHREQFAYDAGFARHHELIGKMFK